MKLALSKISKFFRFLLGAFPRYLPQGMPEQSALVDRLMSTYTLPSAVRDDIAFVVSGTILRFNETTCYKSDWYFVRIIRSVASKQIAGAMFSDIKKRQQDAQKIAAEVTAKLKAVPSDVKPL
jgi:hypothetical protein